MLETKITLFWVRTCLCNVLMCECVCVFRVQHANSTTCYSLSLCFSVVVVLGFHRDLLRFVMYLPSIWFLLVVCVCVPKCYPYVALIKRLWYAPHSSERKKSTHFYVFASCKVYSVLYVNPTPRTFCTQTDICGKSCTRKRTACVPALRSNSDSKRNTFDTIVHSKRWNEGISA